MLVTAKDEPCCIELVASLRGMRAEHVTIKFASSLVLAMAT